MSTTATQTVAHVSGEPAPLVLVNSHGGETSVPRELQRDIQGFDSISDDSDAQIPRLSRFRKITIVTQLSGVNFASSAINGLVVVGLPTITKAVNLPPDLAFWPTSVSNLATASTLLLAGSVADTIGPRTVNLAGCIANGAFILGAGLSQTGPQLVVMRALQGIGYAMHLASSVAIVTHAIPRGRPRNFAFSCLGLSSPLGFSFGLVLGGVLQDLIGWRSAWYIYGGLTLTLAAIAFWALPKANYTRSWRSTMYNIRHTIDWVGALLASTFMALLSYLFAYVFSFPPDPKPYYQKYLR